MKRERSRQRSRESEAEIEKFQAILSARLEFPAILLRIRVLRFRIGP